MPRSLPDRLGQTVPPRISARGKFLWAGERKLHVKGVAYGPFAPGTDGHGYVRQQVVADFAAMARNGVNVVRLYDAPPPWLLDLAVQHGLRVIAGLAWEQHVAVLDDRGRVRAIVRAARAAVERTAGHPALLAWSIGNEIPAEIVRWHGRRAIERLLRRLARAVRRADPGVLVTYANYPSTEYLDLSFLDFLSFNVFLEHADRLAAYLPRLHNLAGERPLVLTELGLDTVRADELAQVRVLREQLRVAYEGGCAGAVVFSWTDEWHRGGAEIEDWAFGLTRRDRTPKPALAVVARVFRDAPFGPPRAWPRISVVVCTHNGAATLADCLDGVAALDYPDFEAVVVDDGSTDASAEIAARQPGVRLVSTAHRGLSHARNVGLAATDGEFVAYLDDDARPDRDWLRHLALRFEQGDDAGVGGPNIQPPVEGLTERAIADGPGGPIHVLLSDTVAEHIPGCNMAFRRSALEQVGGFDERFRVAGDDVDLCWRLQERGWRLGFSPAAVVEHRARTTLRGYWRQQRGYGRAEALLERKWPQRYNAGGHLTWAGRVYGTAPGGPRRWRVYHGAQGAGLFQPAHEQPPSFAATLPLLPEWYGALALLALAGALGAATTPLALLPFVLALAATAVRAGFDARRVVFRAPGGPGAAPLRRWALVAVAHLLQPPARLAGRLGHGLAPWRRRVDGRLALPLPRRRAIWHERWRAPAAHRAAAERALREHGLLVRQGGPYDRWDLELRAGALGCARALLAVEEHGQGRQLVRVRVRPCASRLALLCALASLLAALALARAAAWPLAAAGALAGAAIALWALRDTMAASGAMLGALEAPPPRELAGVPSPAPAPVPELQAVAAGDER